MLSLSRGNSGGPVLGSHGKIVGVAASHLKHAHGSEGLKGPFWHSFGHFKSAGLDHRRVLFWLQLFLLGHRVSSRQTLPLYVQQDNNFEMCVWVCVCVCVCVILLYMRQTLHLLQTCTFSFSSC